MSTTEIYTWILGCGRVTLPRLSPFRFPGRVRLAPPPHHAAPPVPGDPLVVIALARYHHAAMVTGPHPGPDELKQQRELDRRRDAASQSAHRPLLRVHPSRGARGGRVVAARPPAPRATSSAPPPPTPTTTIAAADPRGAPPRRANPALRSPRRGRLRRGHPLPARRRDRRRVACVAVPGLTRRGRGRTQVAGHARAVVHRARLPGHIVPRRVRRARSGAAASRPTSPRLTRRTRFFSRGWGGVCAGRYRRLGRAGSGGYRRGGGERGYRRDGTELVGRIGGSAVT